MKYEQLVEACVDSEGTVWLADFLQDLGGLKYVYLRDLGGPKVFFYRI